MSLAQAQNQYAVAYPRHVAAVANRMVRFAGKAYVYKMHKQGSYIQWVMAEFQEGLPGWGVRGIQKLRTRYQTWLTRLNLDEAYHMPQNQKEAIWKEKWPGEKGCRTKAVSGADADVTFLTQERTCSTHLLIGLLLQASTSKWNNEKADKAKELLQAMFHKFFGSHKWRLDVILDSSFLASPDPEGHCNQISRDKTNRSSLYVTNGMVHPSTLLPEARKHLSLKYHQCFKAPEIPLETWLSTLWSTTDLDVTDWLLRQITHAATREIETTWDHHGFDDDAIEADLKIRIRRTRAQRFDGHMLQQHCSRPSPRMNMRVKKALRRRRKVPTDQTMDRATEKDMHYYLFASRTLLAKRTRLGLSFDAVRASTLVHFPLLRIIPHIHCCKHPANYSMQGLHNNYLGR